MAKQLSRSLRETWIHTLSIYKAMRKSAYCPAGHNNLNRHWRCLELSVKQTQMESAFHICLWVEEFSEFPFMELKSTLIEYVDTRGAY